jgi:hypothetical protein
MEEVMDFDTELKISSFFFMIAMILLVVYCVGL